MAVERVQGTRSTRDGSTQNSNDVTSEGRQPIGRWETRDLSQFIHKGPVKSREPVPESGGVLAGCSTLRVL